MSFVKSIWHSWLLFFFVNISPLCFDKPFIQVDLLLSLAYSLIVCFAYLFLSAQTLNIKDRWTDVWMSSLLIISSLLRKCLIMHCLKNFLYVNDTKIYFLFRSIYTYKTITWYLLLEDKCFKMTKLKLIIFISYKIK